MRVDNSSIYESDGSITSTSITSILRLTDKFQSKLSPRGDLIFASCLVFVGLLSVLGNGSILFVFYSRRRRLSPAEIFLVNLGIVDILLSLASYPCAMLSGFHHRWIFGSTGCIVYAFVCYFLGVASIVSLTAIAIIRFLKTCTPALGNRIQVETSLKIVVWVYIYSLFWACLPLIGFGKYEVEPFGLSCTLEWSGTGISSRIHIIMVSIFCAFLPILIIVFCYSKIILLVRKSDKLVRDKRVRKQNTSVSDAQLTWMSCIITTGFIIGWVPYTLASLWGTFTDHLMLPMWATPIPVLMAKSSIAYNPIIYIFLTRRYRDDFFNLVNTVINCDGRNTINTTNTAYGTEGQCIRCISYDIQTGKKSLTTTTTNTNTNTISGCSVTRIEEHPMELLITKETKQELAQINEAVDTSQDYEDDNDNN